MSSPVYRAAIRTLVDARLAAGLTQREIAGVIGKPPSFIAKIETGERSLGIVEFVVIARAIGNEEAILQEILRVIPKDMLTP